jgi:hypothetical protein
LEVLVLPEADPGGARGIMNKKLGRRRRGISTDAVSFLTNSELTFDVFPYLIWNDYSQE